MPTITTRFAPSPTGYLHIGGLRTALFCYLWAKKHGGDFRLRIEDTDQKREVPGATEHLISMLRQFGLQPDGDIVIQSRRVSDGVYQAAAEKLLNESKAYRCFCSEERLEQVRQEQQARKLPPRYDGHCRSLSADEIERNMSGHVPYVIRLRLPEDPSIVTQDGIHGQMKFDTATLNDAVLIKSDGFPTYHLANVVDDHDMHVTHVIRGEEWIPSLPLHVILYSYLGFDAPEFFHLPLILNPDRSKLSKRQGDVAVESYVEKGYLKEAIINYIAFLGWNPGDDREIFSLDELVNEFDLRKINKAGAVFNLAKLNWYNSWYIKNTLARMDSEKLDSVLQQFLPDMHIDLRLKAFQMFFERIDTLSELTEASRMLNTLADYDPALLIFKKSDTHKTQQGLSEATTWLTSYNGKWTISDLEAGLKSVTEQHNLTFGDVFWPVRVALSGQAASPSPAELLYFFGKEESLQRLSSAQKKLAAVSS